MSIPEPPPFPGSNEAPPAAAAEASDEDFYTENGFVVFTASFLLRRGYCCENGCRHCPYKGAEVSSANP